METGGLMERERYVIEKLVGQHRGKVELLPLQLELRFGPLSAGITERIKKLTSEQLNKFGTALVGFTSLNDAEKRLKRYRYL